MKVLKTYLILISIEEKNYDKFKDLFNKTPNLLRIKKRFCKSPRIVVVQEKMDW